MKTLCLRCLICQTEAQTCSFGVLTVGYLFVYSTIGMSVTPGSGLHMLTNILFDATGENPPTWVNILTMGN